MGTAPAASTPLSLAADRIMLSSHLTKREARKTVQAVPAVQAPARETSQGCSGMQVLCELHNSVRKAAPERQHGKTHALLPAGGPKRQGAPFAMR